jgi:hypothetical protein
LVAAVNDKIEIREIPEAEWPEAARGELIPGSRAFGAFDETGQLSAIIGVFTAVWVDPIWVAPVQRNHHSTGRILLSLWLAVKSFLSQQGVRVALGVGNEDCPGMMRRMRRMGAHEMFRRRLFLIPTGGR